MMASEFTDLSTSPTPSKNTDKLSRKRGGMSGRLRLMPLSDSTPGAYEVSSSPSNNNNSSSGSSSVPGSTLGSGKLKAITQKRDLIEAVRKANSPLVVPGREPVGPESSAANSALPERDSSLRDLEILEDGVNANVRKYNEHKLMVERRQREISVLLDELRALQLETNALSRMAKQETPLSRKSARVQDEIGASTVAMEEQMHVRRQLEHMLRRLQTTQLRVDAQLAALAQAVTASSHESDEVKLLCRQLEAGRSKAVQFLQDVQLQLQVERKARARELGDHEVRARNAQKMEGWRLQRVQERAEMAAEMRGDLSADEEARLLRSIAGRERANEALHAANLAQSERAADFEQALEQLKLATGATTLREVVDKVAAQAGTRVSLDREKTQAEARLVVARQDKDAALRALNELKASGLGGMELSRDVCNALEAEIHQAKATLKVNSAAFERLDGVLSAVRQGAFGLAQRLQAFDDALDTAATPNAGSMPSDGSIMMKQPSLLLLKQHRGGERPSVALAMAAGIGGTTMGLRGESAECLALAEAKLTRILELVGQPSGASVGGFGYGADGPDGAASSGDPALDEATGATARLELLDERNALWSPATNNDPVVHTNNIRVRPDGRPARHRGVALPPPVREDFDPLDSARSDTTASNGGSANDHVDHGRLGDALVPSRIILKMSSSRHCAEVFRKKELAEKERAAAEKGVSDEEMIAKQRKRNQQEADTRLATSPTRHSGTDLLFAHSKNAQAAAGKAKDAHEGPAVDIGSSLAFVTQLSFQDL